MKTQVIATLILAILFGGCASRPLISEKIDEKTDTVKSGILYYLPKNSYDLTYTATLTECKDINLSAKKSFPFPKVSISTAVKTETIADTENPYIVYPQLFADRSDNYVLAFTRDSNGLLTTAQTQHDDKSGEIATNYVKGALTVALAVQTGSIAPLALNLLSTEEESSDDSLKLYPIKKKDVIISVCSDFSKDKLSTIERNKKEIKSATKSIDNNQSRIKQLSELIDAAIASKNNASTLINEKYMHLKEISKSEEKISKKTTEIEKLLAELTVTKTVVIFDNDNKTDKIDLYDVMKSKSLLVSVDDAIRNKLKKYESEIEKREKAFNDCKEVNSTDQCKGYEVTAKNIKKDKKFLQEKQEMLKKDYDNSFDAVLRKNLMLTANMSGSVAKEQNAPGVCKDYERDFWLFTVDWSWISCPINKTDINKTYSGIVYRDYNTAILNITHGDKDKLLFKKRVPYIQGGHIAIAPIINDGGEGNTTIKFSSGHLDKYVSTKKKTQAEKNSEAFKNIANEVLDYTQKSKELQANQQTYEQNKTIKDLKRKIEELNLQNEVDTFATNSEQDQQKALMQYQLDLLTKELESKKLDNESETFEQTTELNRQIYALQKELEIKQLKQQINEIAINMAESADKPQELESLKAQLEVLKVKYDLALKQHELSNIGN